MSMSEPDTVRRAHTTEQPFAFNLQRQVCLKDVYCTCRFNTIENNIRFYTVLLFCAGCEATADVAAVASSSRIREALGSPIRLNQLLTKAERALYDSAGNPYEKQVFGTATRARRAVKAA